MSLHQRMCSLRILLGVFNTAVIGFDFVIIKSYVTADNNKEHKIYCYSFLS